MRNACQGTLIIETLKFIGDQGAAIDALGKIELRGPEPRDRGPFAASGSQGETEAQ
jgi:hypothetical protein